MDLLLVGRLDCEAADAMDDWMVFPVVVEMVFGMVEWTGRLLVGMTAVRLAYN